MYSFKYILNEEDLHLHAKLIAFSEKIKVNYLRLSISYFFLIGILLFFLVYKKGMPAEAAIGILIAGIILYVNFWEKIVFQTKVEICKSHLRKYEKPKVFNKYLTEGERYVLFTEKGLFVSRDEAEIEKGTFVGWSDFTRLIENEIYLNLIAESGISILMKKDSTIIESLNTIKDKLNQIQVESINDVINPKFKEKVVKPADPAEKKGGGV